jgi:outer membrane receptor protein involved in Fe transport
MKPIGQRLFISMIAGVLLAVFAFSIPASAQEDGPETSGEAIETGTVTGTVIDSQTGNVLRGATVAVKGEQYNTQTDIDGKYVLKLPVGNYTLLVSADEYFQQPIDSIKVEARKIQYIDPVLVPQNVLSQEIVVTADTPEIATIKSAMIERQMAQTIIDNVSAEDISKNPDSDAAAVLERVMGVSVIDDKFVYVRGLGERYSSTQVNGSMVPSTDPEKKVVAFDLFPSSLINKVSTLKSFTPDQPGDFSGALVKIDTVEFPAEFVLKYSAGIGFNTNVSLKKTLGYEGSSLDWIGFGVNDRGLPSSFPDERINKISSVTGVGFTPEELQSFGRDLKNEWNTQEYTAAPDISQSITAGGSFGRFGTIFSLTYSHKNSRVQEDINSYKSLSGELIPWNQFTNDKNTETVKMGFVGNVSFKINQNNKLLWKNFYTRDSSDETRLLSGYSSGNTADERDTRLRYLQETMWTTQAAGEHYFKLFADSYLEWRMAYSISTRQEPDLRENIYRSEQGKNNYYFSSEGQSGFRQFSDQEDRILEPGFDWSFYIIRTGFTAELKFGGLYQNRERDFQSRRFIFQVLDRTLDLQQDPEQLFQYDNIAPKSVELREITRFSDTFDAGQDIYAGYAMADVSLSLKWRIVGGVRYENSQIRLSTFDPYKPSLEPEVTRLDNSDPLPAASIIYTVRSGMNLRGSYSRTVNRPEFREIAPFQFTDISGRSTIVGNPDLKQSKIDNLDVRWEWFKNGEDLYAVSFFNKEFDRPIERVLFWAADLLTSYANIESASNRGIELEIKKKLGFISEKLEHFSIYSNYSKIYSNVTIGDIPGLVLTSKERPLQGQADYIFNLNMEYSNPRIRTDFRILYNLVGNRITEVGANKQPDVYEQPNHFLDFSFGHRFQGWNRMQIKFTVKNILNRPIQELQGGRLYNGYKLGRSFGIGISYDLH